MTLYEKLSVIAYFIQAGAALAVVYYTRHFYGKLVANDELKIEREQVNSVRQTTEEIHSKVQEILEGKNLSVYLLEKFIALRSIYPDRKETLLQAFNDVSSRSNNPMEPSQILDELEELDPGHWK